ncbi:cyclopropane-fatty-acyl-phospholipid synthase [Rahnella sp. AA]|uniref:cyclopropane fatty acyl phospholipid synthase n=1 Tax=Rahnella sp. AA TaxID=2057180 RepID=UPI000C32FB97|nr:cyclopropane fatty acyl phospholipid synthase [Rahnella sp. AA]PKE28483.1 cyclopropane-fatty-acyl-phospholipid synthase [Rahnella sp. AA]
MKKNMILPKDYNEWQRICRELLSDAGVGIDGGEKYDIHVKNPKFYKRVLKRGSLALGESYMDGWWDCARLDVFFTRIIRADLQSRVPDNLKDIIRVAGARFINFQSKKGALKVGKEHYDLGNDLFCLMLDPWMQYSCGYWRNADNLFQAQQNKLKLICEKLKLEEGMTLLDIGCGWGGLASYAAEHYGVKVTGITISAEQQKMAQVRCASFDVEILLQDYREIDRQFDRIVSVGMFEHVGPKNYATYFDVVNKNLKPEGIFLLHTIGANKTEVNVDPWINKYIFPNGCLPSLAHIASASERYFVIEDVHNFGSDYDKTLMAWNERFLASWTHIEGNYSERFKRMFTYYLNSCAGAFRSRDIQLWQVVFTRGIEGGLNVPR